LHTQHTPAYRRTSFESTADASRAIAPSPIALAPSSSSRTCKASGCAGETAQAEVGRHAAACKWDRADHSARGRTAAHRRRRAEQVGQRERARIADRVVLQLDALDLHNTAAAASKPKRCVFAASKPSAQQSGGGLRRNGLQSCDRPALRSTAKLPVAVVCMFSAAAAVGGADARASSPHRRSQLAARLHD
jgi:hypothetical protein